MMRADPTVVEVRQLTTTGIVESGYAGAPDVRIRVYARERSAGRHPAGQAVDAAVIVRPAPTISVVIERIGRVIGAARDVRQSAEIVVERVVLLHDDDDVIDPIETRLGERWS